MEQFKQLLHQSDLEGKIIKRVIFTDENCVIHFYNNEFCVLTCSGYEMPYVELKDDAFSLEIKDHSIWRLRNYGLLQEDEYKILESKFSQIKEAKKEDEEKKLFEQLKTKYGS